MGNLGLKVEGVTWLEFLASLTDLTDKSKSDVILCYAQVYCYHIWRERNHNLGVFGPTKLLQGISKDIRARFHGSIWFSKLVCSRADLHSYTAAL